MEFIDGTINICKYTKIVADKMATSLQRLNRRGIFQHDNELKHTKKITNEFLRKKKVKDMTWAKMSPKLNPIEHLWGILNRKAEQHNISSKEQLKKLPLKNDRTSLQKSMQDWVSSTLRRIESVIKSKGEVL